MNLKMLEKYKKLDNEYKNNLNEMLACRNCYDRDSNISDETVLNILEIAKKCYLYNKNNIKANIDDYANYILDGIYISNISIEKIKKLDIDDIVKKYNAGVMLEKIIKFDKDGLDYCITTNDNEVYYCNNESFYIIDEDGFLLKQGKIKKLPYIVFDLLNNDNIGIMTLSTHYKVREEIKSNILKNDELKSKYEKSIKNYNNYCNDRFITGSDILLATKKNNINIDLFDIDKKYSDSNKMKSLKDIIGNDSKNYCYVASINNGNDYYFNKNNNTYLVLDKNNIVKHFDNEACFLLKEIKIKDKFSYISKEESDKIFNDLKNIDTHLYFVKNNKYGLKEYIIYDRNKELHAVEDEILLMQLQCLINSLNRSIVRDEKKFKNKSKDIER